VRMMTLRMAIGALQQYYKWGWKHKAIFCEYWVLP
jgi:hypothetical protein